MRIPESVDLRSHKLKRMVPAPNSYFLKVKCKCEEDIQITFSNGQTTLVCRACGNIMAKPRGGKIFVTEGCQFSVLGINEL